MVWKFWRGYIRPKDDRRADCRAQARLSAPALTPTLSRSTGRGRKGDHVFFDGHAPFAGAADEFGEPAAVASQVIGGALFGDLAVLDHVYRVGLEDEAGAVAGDDGGAAFHEAVE